MRSALIGSVTGAFLLMLSTMAYADPPMGVGAAVTDSGFECFFQTVVAPGGGATPILPGGFGIVLTSTVENTRIVFSNSNNGNINLSCVGKIEFGSTITGYDFITNQLVTATVAQFGPACDAVNAVFPGVCNGKGAAILDAEIDGGACEIVPGVFTFDWQHVTTPSGRVMLECHALID